MFAYIATVVLFYLLIKWSFSFLKIRRCHGDLYIIVTGCDSGFGRELVYKLDTQGFNVFAVCLTQEAAIELKDSTSDRIRTAIVNITKPNDISVFLEMVQNLLPNEKALWGVVNNAGIMRCQGPCAILTKEDYQAELDVNLFGMVEMNRRLIPLLRKSGGRIINMSSVVGKLAMGFAPYCVSKFAVEAYSDCLRRDLYHQGVSVHIIEPQPFSTSLVARLNKHFIKRNYEKLLDRLPRDQREYYGEEYAAKVGEVYENTVVKPASKAKYLVVDAYFHALTARFPKPRYIVGLNGKIVCKFLWSCPEWMSDLVTATIAIDSVKPAGLIK